MNKEILDKIPADEQAVAAKLQAVADDMQLSPTFEWELEIQLMEKHKEQTRPAFGWFARIAPTLGWAFTVICVIFLVNWAIRSLVPGLSAGSSTQQPDIAPSAAPSITPMPTAIFTPIPSHFEEDVRHGNICAGPLAVGHDFSVSLTNQDKTGFVAVDPQNVATELHSFAWSPDGRQLAVIGNTGGQGNIYVTDSAEHPLRPLLSNPEVGYLRDASWSRDGNKLVLWSSQNISTMYLVDADGSNLIERELGVQIFGTPQIAPDNRSIIFYGADSSADGLFQARLDGSQPRLINDLVEDASSFAWSPDGTRLAYFEMDRTLGEARLIEEFANGSNIVIANLPIPKGSSSTIPEVSNLSWSADGQSVVFDFGSGAFSGRAVYLARADGIGFIKVAESAHSPTISADGRCLAYIRDKQVFVLDLNDPSLSTRSTFFNDFKPPSKPILMDSMASTAPTPLFLADLPTGRSASGTDKLQWAPAANLIRWNP